MSSLADARIADDELPSWRMRFVGRDTERARLVSLLADRSERIVTLTGPGGAGKTRLLVEAVTTWRVANPVTVVVFLDGVPLTAGDQVIPALVAQLGLDPSSGASAGELLSEYLAGRDALLLLDNMEHLLDAVPELAALLRACRGVRIFSTSRSLLRLEGERSVVVDPLPVDSALELFIDRAERAGVEWTDLDAQRATLEAICARLDGLPLALELGAARLRLLSPKALLANLTHQLTMLTGGPVDAQPHHRAMRNAIAWSYQLLAPEEQRLLAWLSVFPESFSLDLAAAVGSEPPIAPVAMLDRLVSLIDQGMLLRVAETDRFRMLIGIREFSREELDARGETDACERRFAEQVTLLAERIEPELIGPEQAAGFARLAHEDANLRRALELQIVSGDREGALRLSGALWRHWLMRGRWQEAAETYRRVFALGDPEPTVTWAKALRGAAVIAETRAEWGDAERFDLTAIEILSALGDRTGEAKSVIDLGNVYSSTGRFDLAVTQYARAFELATVVGDSRLALIARASLGINEYRRGRARAAAEHCAAIMPDARKLDDPWLLALAMANFGAVLHGLHRDEEAAMYHRESLELRRALQDDYGIATSLVNLAGVEADPRRAESLAREGLELARAIGGVDTLHGAALTLGALVLDRGERREATEFFIESLEVAYAANNLVGCADSIDLLAEVLATTDEQTAARMLGMAAGIRNPIGAIRSGDHADRTLAVMSRLESRLGSERVRAAFREGESIELADAIVSVTLDTRAALRTGQQAAIPARELAALSPRELDVLRLIAEGKTDRQIGDALFISPKTVNHHATRILMKLEVRNRAAAVALATRHGVLGSEAWVLRRTSAQHAADSSQ